MCGCVCVSYLDVRDLREIPRQISTRSFRGRETERGRKTEAGREPNKLSERLNWSLDEYKVNKF